MTDDPWQRMEQRKARRAHVDRKLRRYGWVCFALVVVAVVVAAGTGWHPLSIPFITIPIILVMTVELVGLVVKHMNDSQFDRFYRSLAKLHTYACDGPDCHAEGEVVGHGNSPPGWKYADAGPNTDRLDFCSWPCMAAYAHQQTASEETATP